MSLTYRQLQQSLKALRSSGTVITCKLNAKTAVLQAEYDRHHTTKVLRSETKDTIVTSYHVQPTRNVVLKGYEPSPVGYVPIKRYAYNKEDMPNRLAAPAKPYRRVTDVAWVGRVHEALLTTPH